MITHLAGMFYLAGRILTREIELFLTYVVPYHFTGSATYYPTRG